MSGVTRSQAGQLRIEAQAQDLQVAAQRLQASETRYRRLFEAAKDGILILDADSGRIVDVNPFLVELTGYSHEHFLGRHLWEIGPFKDAAASRASFAALQACDYVRYDDLPLQARDGRRIDVEFVSNVYRVEDQRVIQCNVRDITARKAAEAERLRLEGRLRTSQKLEAIGSLAGGVAHDFNNLLSVILSYVGLVLEAVKPGDPLREDLLEVKRAGERGAALTRQLLAFSRKQVLQPVLLDLNRVVTDVERMLRRLVGEDIEMVQRLAPDLGVVRADPGQMDQVLVNLVVNARDAMPAGGTLTIATLNVTVGEAASTDDALEPAGAYVQLEVTDTGGGMDDVTRSRAFEPFFTTKEEGKGTGLGLSTVYGIVKQSGGGTWVQSAPGRGTTIRIHLPRLPATSAGLPPPAALPLRDARGSETVLVVEDEEALRKVVRRTLLAAGYTVLTAADGEAAREVFRRHAGGVQLLLTDVVMPRLGGWALAREQLARQPGLRVIYMSGHADAASGRRGDEPPSRFLAKPFTAPELARRVREVLDEGARATAPSGPPPPEAEAPPPPGAAALQALPTDLLRALAQAAAAARYDELEALLERVAGLDPALAAGLRRLAERFDRDALLLHLGPWREAPRAG